MTEFEYIQENKTELAPLKASRVFLDKFMDYPEIDIWAQDSLANTFTAFMDRLRKTEKRVKKYVSLFPITLPAPDIEASSPAPNQILITWPAIPNADGYLVSILKDGDEDPSLYEEPSTTFEITGVTPATLYTVQVAAKGDTQFYSNSPYTTAQVITANPIQLSAPTILDINTFDDITTISWSVESPYGYTLNIFRHINSSTVEVFSLDPEIQVILNAGETYTIKVRAEGNEVDGYITSPFSGEEEYVPTNPLDTPVIVITPVSSTAFTASWAAIPGAAFYQWSLYKVDGEELIDQQLEGGLFVDFTGLDPETEYRVELIAQPNDPGLRDSDTATENYTTPA